MTQQINSSPLVGVALLPMTDDSHSLLRQLLMEASRPTVVPRQEAALVKSRQALSRKEVVIQPTRVRYAYD